MNLHLSKQEVERSKHLPTGQALKGCKHKRGQVSFTQLSYQPTKKCPSAKKQNKKHEKINPDRINDPERKHKHGKLMSSLRN
jgi:hypothetical protein